MKKAKNMNAHQEFHAHLSSLPNSAEILRACSSYKASTDGWAFELNGRLRGGLPLEKFEDDFAALRSAIRASSAFPITLYRMTSDIEFSVSLLGALSNRFRYQAFMSTATESFGLNSFIPNSGKPLLLEIECPSGIAFAPLDMFPGMDEREYLLGCGSTFSCSHPPKVLRGGEISEYLALPTLEELTLLHLRIVENPPYVRSEDLFQLSLSS